MLLSMMSHSELQNDLNHLISWSEKWLAKIQHVEMQSASFWTVRYQTLYDDEY